MNKTLPDIFKDTEDLKTSRGLEWAPRKYLGIHCCKYLNRKQIKCRNFRKLKKLVLIYGVFHMQNNPRYMVVGGGIYLTAYSPPSCSTQPPHKPGFVQSRRTSQESGVPQSQCLKR